MDSSVRVCLWGLFGVLVLAGTLPGCTSSEADAGMPVAQRAYWDWIYSINRDPATAVETGGALLERYPALRPLYLRLADICREREEGAACRSLFDRLQPPDTLTALYREAAMIRLLPRDDAAPHWQRLAAAPALNPGLARLIVDAGLHKQETWLPGVESGWRARLAADSSALGAAFGLGYAAVRRGERASSERLLRHVIREAPDDPEAYRELGRLYFNISRTDAFEVVLRQGIEAARHRHDLQTELILRGNLGWGIVLKNGDLEEAGQVLTKALEQSRTLADGESEAFNLYRLANVHIRQQHFREALSLLVPADTLYARYNPRQRAEVQILQGTALKGLFRFSDAEAVLSAAIADAEAQKNISSVLNGLVVLAELQYQMGRYTSARATAFDALARAQRYQAVRAEVSTRLVLGDVENRWGNFDAAVVHYEEGLALALARGLRTDVRRMYQRLGRTALDLRDPSRAKAQFDALLQYEQDHADSLSLALTYIGLGQVYTQFGNHRQAAGYYQDAERVLPARASARQRFDILLNEAWNALDRQAPDEAERYLDQARNLLRADLPENIYAFKWNLMRGQLDLAQRRYASALDHFEQVLQWERKNVYPTLRWQVLYGMALAHWRLGHRAEAEAHFRESLAVTEAMRDNLYSRENRASFIQNKIAVYKDFASFLEARGRIGEAFYYTEAARSRSLVDLLFTTQQDRAVEAGDATDNLIEAERRRQAIAETLAGKSLELDDNTALNPLDGTRTAELRRAYREADSLYQAGLARLPEAHLFRALLTMKPLSVSAARALLRDDEALLTYSLRDTAAVAFVLTPDTLFLQPLAVEPATLGESIHFFRDQLQASVHDGTTRWEKTSRRLYDRLVGPVMDRLPASVRHVHLVPEGPLYYLPFDVLQDAEGRFLVERVSLSVTPSAGVLAVSQARNPGRWESILLVADPDGHLPGTRREVDAIARLSGVRPLALVGDRADRENLLRYAGAYDVVHIATHGRFVPNAPWSSHLELHGGVLGVADIARLNLNAYLVTLSACETALGGGLHADVPVGDEWVGLNQAFLAAGTPTVMASLWPIDDQVSSVFMTGFYEALLQTGHKARALAHIQRQFIRDPRTRHPFFWAPFTLIGDPR